MNACHTSTTQMAWRASESYPLAQLLATKHKIESFRDVSGKLLAIKGAVLSFGKWTEIFGNQLFQNRHIRMQRRKNVWKETNRKESLSNVILAVEANGYWHILLYCLYEPIHFHSLQFFFLLIMFVFHCRPLISGSVQMVQNFAWCILASGNLSLLISAPAVSSLFLIMRALLGSIVGFLETIQKTLVLTW